MEPPFNTFLNYIKEHTESDPYSEIGQMAKTGKFAHDKDAYLYMQPLPAIAISGAAVQIRFALNTDSIIELSYFIGKINGTSINKQFYEVLNDINIHSQVGVFTYRDESLLLYDRFSPRSFDPAVVFYYMRNAVTYINNYVIPRINSISEGDSSGNETKSDVLAKSVKEYYPAFQSYFGEKYGIVYNECGDNPEENFLVIYHRPNVYYTKASVNFTVKYHDRIEVKIGYSLATFKSIKDSDYKDINDANCDLKYPMLYVQGNNLYVEFTEYFSVNEFTPETLENTIEEYLSTGMSVAERRLGLFLKRNTDKSMYKLGSGSGATILPINPFEPSQEDADKYDDPGLDYDIKPQKSYNDGAFTTSELADYYGYDSSMGISEEEFLDNL